MNLKKTKPNFTDVRGEIRDILTHATVDGITIITCTRGAVRGNHYHKKTEQYDYIVSGKLQCVSQKIGTNKKVRKILKAGDLAYHPANEAHAFKAIEPTVFISITHGPRKGMDYEKDVFRLETPLIKRA